MRAKPFYLVLAAILVVGLAPSALGHEPDTTFQGTITAISQATGSFTVESPDKGRITVIMQSSTTVMVNGQARVGRAALAGLELGARVAVVGKLVAEGHLVAATVRVLQQAARTPPVRPTVVTGRVVARTSTSLTIASSTGMAMEATLSSSTRVTGQRASLAEIAVGDLLRLHGAIDAGVLMITQIEVVGKGDARSSSQSATNAAVSGGSRDDSTISLSGVIQIRLP